MTAPLKKVIVITGANSGLGYETALYFAKLNEEVVLACRNLKKGNEAKNKILSSYPNSNIAVYTIDLSVQRSVKDFVKKFSANYQQLDVLVNNAGIMMTPFEITEDGFENQFATNYLGHYTLTGLLMPLLLTSPGSRVISLSSLAHKWSNIQFDDINFLNNYTPAKAYGQSKLACLIFAYELERRFREHHCDIKSVVAHPGLANTNLPQAMPKFMQWIAPLFTQSANSGAQPIIHAATSNNVIGGEYYGPNGLKEWWGDPTLVESNDASKNLNTAKDLWNLSEKLTGIKYKFELTQLQS